jgi:rhodanese-related sulfurtransferase
VFVADATVDRDDLVWAALTIGFERLVGEVAGGVYAWAAAGRPLVQTRLADDAEGRTVVDIRQRAEFTAGHVDGALHVELGSLTGAAEGLPSAPLLVHCGHGERAMTAASLLQRAGRDDVAVMAGPPEQLGPLVREA